MPTLQIRLNNSLSNFNYLIWCDKTRDCLVVDPLDVDIILKNAHHLGLNITQIVNTHEHGDHTGGNIELGAKTGAKIMAHHAASQLIPGFEQGLRAGDHIQIGETITLNILETPGHTPHSICLHDEINPAIYTGDTLFNCGCGNCHHGGDPAIMFHTFETQLQYLHGDTLIYPGHDYIGNNLAFAKSLQPDLRAISVVEKKLADNERYISTISEDKTVDPFFRLDDEALIQAVVKQTPLSDNPSRKDVFLALRALRNMW